MHCPGLVIVFFADVQGRPEDEAIRDGSDAETSDSSSSDCSDSDDMLEEDEMGSDVEDNPRCVMNAHFVCTHGQRTYIAWSSTLRIVSPAECYIASVCCEE